MTELKNIFIFFTLFLFLFGTLAVSTTAQNRVNYVQLANQPITPPVFIDYHITEVENGNAIWFDFRIPYSSLQFRSAGNEGFSSDTELIITLREGELPRGQRSLSTSYIDRIIWNKRVEAKSFDESRSRETFISGIINTTLQPGTYHYSVTLRTDGISRDFRSMAREFKITSDASIRDARMFFTKVTDNPTTGSETIGIGRSIPYAEDFGLFVRLKDGLEFDNLSVKVFEIERLQDSTNRIKLVYEYQLNENDLFTSGNVTITNERDAVNYLRFTQSDNLTYAYLTIPNNKFENKSFEIELFNDNEEVISRSFQTFWIDIPRSLLNIDIAIANMSAIIDESTLREMRRGNQQERQRKFYAFWNERDPEPDRHFNPLMVEYFKRVDEAFRRFSSPNTAGHESDRGKVFLRNGEPNSIERFFPTNAPATEVWIYGSRRFVFEATTGFGDYVLRN